MVRNEVEHKDFFITFGQQYRHIGHPAWVHAHPDGWVRIQAGDEYEARQAAMRWFGPQWAFIYDEESFADSRHFYPKGELGVATIQTLTKSQTSDEPTGE